MWLLLALGELGDHVPRAPEETTSVEMQAVRRLMRAIAPCFKSDPGTLELTIAAGRLKTISGGDELRRCALAAARSWRYPQSEATLRISYPLR